MRSSEPRSGRTKPAAVRRGALALALTSLAPSCRDEARPQAERVVPDVEVEGCTRIHDGTCRRPPPGPNARCEGASMRDADMPPDATPLRVWARDADPSDLRLDDAPPLAIRDGIAVWDVLAPADAQRLSMTRASTQVWSLALEPAPAEPEVLIAARQALGGLDAATARAHLLAELAAMPDAVRAAALDVVTDLEYQLAKLEHREVPLDHLEQAFDLAVSRNELDRASCHARRAIHEAVDRADFDLATHWLERVSGLGEVAPRNTARNAYSRGIVLRALGDLHRAREALELAEAGAVEHEDTLVATASRQQLAEVSAALGRELELAQRLDAMASNEGSLACDAWVHALNGAGWAQFLARDIDRAAPDPIPELEAALLVAAWVDDPEDRCFEPAIVEDLRLNLALAAEAEGWIGWAEQLRAQLPSSDEAPPERRFWLEQLDDRLALRRGDAGELAEISMRERTDDQRPQYVWLREHTRGRAFEAIGLPNDALSAYAQADAALQSIMLRVDVDEGRDRLLLGRQPSSARRIALLTAMGRPEEALCVARVARARASHVLDRAARIAALDSTRLRSWANAVGEYENKRRHLDRLREERWEIPGARLAAHDAAIAEAERELDAAGSRAHEVLGAAPLSDTCEDLRGPEPGELVLLYFPIGSEWIAFAFAADEPITTAFVPRDNPSALLDPFAAQIREARNIRILPSAELWDVPFASLPFDGAPLVEHAPVVLSLDLRRRSTAPPPPSRALVVGDPRGDLAAAAAEARGVAARLEAVGIAVDLLVGSDARAQRWRERIADVELFHYAGHGSQSAFEGWGSAIRLANDESVDVTDVLSLPSVPSVAILPACETAGSGDPGLGGAMNLARAFVLAGSELVIASRTELRDEVAHDFVLRLYAAELPTPRAGPSVLRTAQLGMHDPQRWSVFALVP